MKQKKNKLVWSILWFRYLLQVLMFIKQINKVTLPIQQKNIFLHCCYIYKMIAHMWNFFLSLFLSHMVYLKIINTFKIMKLKLPLELNSRIIKHLVNHCDFYNKTPKRTFFLFLFIYLLKMIET